ncbi:MAG: hypothetical protein WBV82_07215 [Myxococcaceae bacterium]
MRRPTLGMLAALAATLAMTGCALDGALRDSRTIENDVAELHALIESLEVCTNEEVSSATPVETIDPAAGQYGVFRGRLGLGEVVCTAMACSDRACCNGCGGTLALSSEGSEAVPFTDAMGGTTYALGATDCSVEKMRELANDTEVVVRGRFEAAVWPDLKLSVEHLCRIASRP